MPRPPGKTPDGRPVPATLRGSQPVREGAEERMLDDEAMTGERLLERLVSLCRERRGNDLVALDVRELVEYMDYLLIATARSERQNRAVAEHVIRGLKQAGVMPLSRAGLDGGTWICIDFVDVVLHLFTPDTRTHYDLELLWGDAPRVELPAPVPEEVGDAPT